MPARPLRLLVGAGLLAALPGCALVGTSVGPSRAAVDKAASDASIPGLRVVDLQTAVALQASESAVAQASPGFAEVLGGSAPAGTVVGIGDTLEISIWEASPPALFGTANLDSRIGSPIAVSQAHTLPGFLVTESGTISVPFAGQVPVAGRTPTQIEQDIVRRLRGKAHLPQVNVRIARNVAATVSVLGDVSKPSQIPLTPHGERLLDVISQAGGTSQPLDRMMIQVTRGDIVRTIPARDVLASPRNNVVLRSGDVVTVLHQPRSFTVLGAAGKNEQVRFEGDGLSLAEALGRVGGLQNDRADPKGVFIFRWEQPDHPVPASYSPDGQPGQVPVIYRADLKNPATYLAAQKFGMRDGDVLYISNSPAADFQRFVSFLASSIIPISTVRSIVP